MRGVTGKEKERNEKRRLKKKERGSRESQKKRGEHELKGLEPDGPFMPSSLLFVSSLAHFVFKTVRSFSVTVVLKLIMNKKCFFLSDDHAVSFHFNVPYMNLFLFCSCV